jgi:predicted nicotinamide N-methyase
MRPRYPAAFPNGPFVYEYTAVSALVAEWSEGNGELDPFGVVLWPAADMLAELVSRENLHGCTTLELGCGTGLCSLVAASQGASRAIATDFNPAPLELVSLAAKRQKLGAIETGVFDMCSAAELPPGVDLLLAADVCYNEKIARSLARRCKQASVLGIRCLIADSVNIARDFLVEELGILAVEYSQEVVSRSFSGHAVSLDQDVERTCSIALFRIPAIEH